MGYKKIITWFLIGLLISQEIVRIPYSLSTAEAMEVDKHENIVSLIVEENIFQKMKNDIEKYAFRIQSVLPQTRTVILTFSEDTHPLLIASANERLYYSGIPNHGNNTQKLVGTILIGDIPLPTVYKNSKSFLSIFPYVDFDEPNFVWNWDKNMYEYLDVERKKPQADIWHSVIAPHTNTLDQDVVKLREFFARVYDYDNKRGRYTDIGRDPQVFYADTVRDGRATSRGTLAAYEKLFLPYQEHFRYNRYIKEFAMYLYENYLALMKSQGNAEVKPFSEWVASSTTSGVSSQTPSLNLDTAYSASANASFLSKSSDISTRVFARELIPEFIKTLSEKYIGDVSRWIHQTGRYYNGYSEVRADTMPELIQTRDAISVQILQEINDSLEKAVNEYIEGSLSLDIPVLVSRAQSSRGHDFSYTNYFFGEKAIGIQDAAQCSLLRGSKFGPVNTVTEMNHGYHVQGVKEDINLITKDVQEGIRCNNNTSSYWGGNSPMNLTTSGGVLTLKDHKYDDFSQSVYDPAGGKRTSGKSSPFDCLKTDLLLDPYVRRVNVRPFIGEYKWPKETSGKRYSCVTNFNQNTEYFGLNPSPESRENIFQTLISCQGKGNISLLNRDGSVLNTCASQGPGGTYKLVSSLVRHTSPDNTIYGKQLTSLATPNLPVDEQRYVVYIDRQVKERQFNYPNIFDIQVPIGATDDEIKLRVRDYLKTFDTQLLSQKYTGDLGVFSHLVPQQGFKNDISLADIVAKSPDLEKNIIASLRWRNLPTSMKYQQGIMDALQNNKPEGVAYFGDNKRTYEISYMGGKGTAKNFIIGYQPNLSSEYPSWYNEITEVQNEYNYTTTSTNQYTYSQGESFELSSEDYDELLGTEDSPDSEDSSDSDSSDSCGNENAVVIWEWLSAIQCWLSNLFDTEWESWDSDYSFDWEAYLSLTFGSYTLFSTENETLPVSQSDENDNGVIDEIENTSGNFILRNIPSDYVLKPKNTIRLTTLLEKNGSQINDDTSRIEVNFLRIANLDSGIVYTPNHPDWESVKKQYISVEGSRVLTDGKASWILRSLSENRVAIELETQIRSGTSVYIRSEKLSLSSESTFPSFTLLSTPGSVTPKTVKADDPNGVTLLFDADVLPKNMDVEIADYITNKIIIPRTSFPVVDKKIKITSPTIDPVLHRAGKYIITLTNNGLSQKTDLVIISGSPKKIQINTPKILLSQEKYSVDILVTDQWGNSVDVRSGNGVLRTSDPVISRDSSKPTQEIQFSPGKKIFLQPMREGTLKLDVSIEDREYTLSESIITPVLSDIQIEANIQHTGVIKVGQTLPVEFTVKTKNGTLVKDWDMPIKIATKGVGAHLKNGVVSFSDGKGSSQIITGTQAGKFSFYFAELLSGKKIGNDIEIYPEAPHRLTFSGPDTLLAKTGISENLFVHIFDKYGNYIHPSTLDLRISFDRSDLIGSSGKIERIVDDMYGVRLRSLGYPGRVLLRGEVWEDGKKVPTKTLENVWEINILPVIESKDIANNAWNTLTYVLLGGPFGQFVTSGYFGGGLLFSPDTRALSVSTLVDNPRPGIFSVAHSGALQLLGTPRLGAGLQLTWHPHASGLFALTVSDKRLGNLAQVNYPRLSEEDSLSFIPSGSDITFLDNVLYYAGTPLTDLDTIFDTPELSFSPLKSATDLRFNVIYNTKSIGTVILKYTSKKPVVGGLQPNAITVQMFSSHLISDTIWGSTSSAESPGILVLESSSSGAFIGGPVEEGFSAYPESYGMGWTGSNLGLLQFASGDTWAQSQQAFSDYVTINLGDPLIQLPEYKVDRETGFDATLGIPVFSGRSIISDFNFQDNNNDQQKDLIVIDDEKTISVGLSKKNGDYLDIGDFLSVENARKDTLRTGDFFADGYVDSVYIDQTGILRLISHDGKISQEKEIVSDRTRDIGYISQMEVFDMDNDAHDDIIILDTLGQISIFYGLKNNQFRYQFVDHAFDFDFSEKTLFSGAISYEYPGFSLTNSLQSNNALLRLQQEQIQSMLFTTITLPKTATQTSTNTTGTNSVGGTLQTIFTVDANAGSGDSLTGIGQKYTDLARQYGSSLQVSQGDSTRTSLYLLKAPFIDNRVISIHKKYTSLEKENVIVGGSRIQGVISIKNISTKQISNLVLAENFPSYLERPISSYILKKGDASTERNFTDYSDGGVADLRGITLAPGETIEIIYTAKFATFSFGTFDVGYLEDKNDPLMNIDVKKEKILTIHPDAKTLASIPEKDFYNHDMYGDIRINPNNTCGGPLFLWRSHNTFDRTYQKTLIVRNIQNPDDTAMNISNDPLDSVSAQSSVADEILSTLQDGSSSAALEKISEQYSSTVEEEFDTYNNDSDGDDIPDRHDEDTGDIFSLENSGNTSQITVTLGKLDDALDDAIEGVETFMSGLSCGFGQPGCIAQPMNWTINVPGNTITVLGYGVPGLNQAPLACYKDVRCGIPIFSAPTASAPYYWPPNPDKAGGAFDVGVTSIAAGELLKTVSFIGGYGVSEFRLFIGATLTGAIAEVMCFGPNNILNPTINFPGLFPINFMGNCIFAAQPLMQCSDDGSDDVVIDLETDEVEVEESDSGSGDDMTQITDANDCGFFDPTTSYPQSLIDAVHTYLASPTESNLEKLRVQISQYAGLITGIDGTDSGLLFATSSPYEGITETVENDIISYPDSGNGIIKVSLDPSSFSGTGLGSIVDVQLKSITAFPKFLMDWYHRQLDEIVSSLGALPDIKIFLPDLGSGFSDGGWKSQFSGSSGSTSLPASSSASSSTDYLTPVDTATSARDSVVSGIQGGLGGIQAAFEYLSLLPMVDVHPRLISLDLPWMDRSALQSWIYRNEAILAQWEALPESALSDAVDASGLIASIRSNIETVRTYMTLPEQLQNLFYLKEKFLYEILKNVHAIQQLMGGWLYNNGERFKTWVETFILITKLWDLWQILIDIFDDYEESCAVCHNEQWNLQEWLWIIISIIIPPIPVIKMPKWPDIELDFSDIDLGIDIAYPVFNFSFYPLQLPDMPSPNFSGLTLPTVPQLPPLPDLNLDFEVPTIPLPKLPNLPPAPTIPELSQAISIVLKIFKIVTLIQCLYRKVPLSPEWYVGTKIAHKTDRQGYLPIDFLNSQIPSVVVKWIDAFRVSAHVELTYDVDYIIDVIQSALEPLEDFPRDLSQYTGDIPSSVNIDLDSDSGSTIQTSSLEQLPLLIGQLYEYVKNPRDAQLVDEIGTIDTLLSSQGHTTPGSPDYQYTDPSVYHDRFQENTNRIISAIQQDIDTNKNMIADLGSLTNGDKDFSHIAWLQTMNPHVSQLASSTNIGTDSALLRLAHSLKNTSGSTLSSPLLPLSVTPSSSSTSSDKNISFSTQVQTQQNNSTKTKTSQGFYITKNGSSKRLNYFYEDQEGDTVFRMIDDDNDGDKDIFYSLGKNIYRKENYTHAPQKIYSKQSPQIFSEDDIWDTFFGIKETKDISLLPHDSQVYLRETHTPEDISLQYLLHKKADHRKFDIFSTWGNNDPRYARYRVDILAPDTGLISPGYTILSYPVVSDVSGEVTLLRKKPYRILYPGYRYIDGETGKTQELPTDFVIRSGKYAYAKERTVLETIVGNDKKQVILESGKVLLFTKDSQINIQKGSLVLPSDDYASTRLQRSDIFTPLFPDDQILTGKNGTTTVLFPDSTTTSLSPEQKWTFMHHASTSNRLQDVTIPVEKGWYYVASYDAHSSSERRTVTSTLFDAYTDDDREESVDTLPTKLYLNFDTPTEIDFTQYFPLNTLKKVEIFGLSESFWKQITATKIAFQTMQKDSEVTVRVTFENGYTVPYSVQLVTQPARLAISSVDTKKNVTGTISQQTTLPVSLQSFLQGKSWTLSSSLAIKDTTFSGSFATVKPQWQIAYENAPVFGIERDTGFLGQNNGIEVVSDIQVGHPLAVRILLNKKPITRIIYQPTNTLNFRQIATAESISKNTLSLLSSSLRLEPSLSRDTVIPGGAYIVDQKYNPILIFDAEGNIRYIDTNILIRPQYEAGLIAFVLYRDQVEIGKLFLSGDMLTAWDQ